MTLTNIATTPLVPSVPGNVRASALNNNVDGTDRLEWNAVTNTGGVSYEVQRRQVGQSWEAAVAATGTQHDFAKASGTSGGAYDYRVRAKTSAGDSAWSGHVTVAGRPGSPSVTATASTTEVAVTLSWAAPSNGGKTLTGYRIEWRADASGDWVANPATGNTTAGASATGATITAANGLQTNTVYDFRVRADNPDRQSFYSSTAQADQATLNVAARISSPASLTEGGLDGATLTVDLVGTEYVSSLSPGHFGVNPGPAGTSISSVERVGDTRAVLTLGFTGDFSADTVIAVTVSAFGHTGSGQLSTPTIPVTAELAPGETRIASLDGGPGTITVNWDAVSDADGYKVQWRGPGDVFDPERQIVIADGNTRTAVIPGLAPSTTYSVQVISTKRLAPDALPSPQLAATTAAISARISSPSSLTERGLDGARLTVDLDGTQYVSSLTPGDFGLLPQGIGGLSVASVDRQSDTRAVLTLAFSGNIAANFDLQVAVDGSAHTSSGTLTTAAVRVTPAPRPGQVASVTATGGPGSLTVTWNAASNADGYTVSWWPTGNPGDVESRRATGGSTTRTDIGGLAGETGYSVRVVAYSDYAPDGTPSNTASATTEPADARVSATNPSPLTESNLNGARLTVELLNASWAGTLSTGQFQPSGVPGVSVRGVTRDSGSRATVTLDFDGDDPATDFDAGRTLRLAIAASAHSEAEAFTATVGVAAVVEAAPARVQGVALTPGPQRIEADWDAVPGATGYRVSWTPPGAGGLSSTAARGESTRHVIQYLAPDTDYTVTVVATKSRAPDGAASAGRTARTPAFGARISATEPAPLTEQNLNEAVLTVELEGAEWALGVPRYRFRVQGVPVWVERVERVSGARVAVVLAYAGADFDEDATLRLTIDEETHGWRDDVTVTVPVTATDEVTPGQVTGVTARSSPGLVLVEWERVAGAHGYRVQWRESSEHGWNDADTTRQRTTGRSYLPVSGLLAGTSYTARVRAITVKAPAEGAWSADATATTPLVANTPATGAPVITGAARVGQTLRAGRGTIADADGVPVASGFTWQWVWVESDGAENDIAGASSDTYAVTDTDLGRRLKVRATFTDDAGNAESRTSAASAVVVSEATEPPVPPGGNTLATGAPVITGAAQVGETLTAGAGDIADANGLANVSYAWQWIRVESDGTEADIAGATAATYTPVAADLGRTLKVRASFTDDAGNAEALTSAATAPVTAASTDRAVHRIGLFPAAARWTESGYQGFVRVINRSDAAGTVRIEAYDDEGVAAGPVTLAIGAGEAAHFNSEDLEEGNAAKGLSGGIGTGSGHWRLALASDLDLEVMGYIRTDDGFVTAMHDLVSRAESGHDVVFFNPGSNRNQVSRLRLINRGAESAEVTIVGVDDDGESPGTAVSLSVPAGGARMVTAQALESEAARGEALRDLSGALGDGTGKWRLRVTSEPPIVVMSLLSSPTGHLANLSTAPDNTESGEDDATSVHRLPLILGADDPQMREGFVRIINRSDEAGEVRIEAIDDAGMAAAPVTLDIGAGEAVNFNSDDLEEGNADKGLSAGVGDGAGDWRLALASALDLQVLGYIRTDDGFVTSMHDLVPHADGTHRVVFFNPGGNASQVSRLRLVNPGESAVEVRIEGIDSEGRSPGGTVTVEVPAGAARTLTAQTLESGEGVSSMLGDGDGKWRLTVSAQAPIEVMSLLASPTGHLTNLSTAP